MTTITMTLEETAIYDESWNDREVRALLDEIRASAVQVWLKDRKPVTIETADGIVVDVIQEGHGVLTAYT